MGKYFGTDGFRGEANVNLTADHAFQVGRFLGWYYGELKRANGIIALDACTALSGKVNCIVIED